MKRITKVLMILIIVMAITQVPVNQLVKADLISTPADKSQVEHWKQCESIHKNYILNGKKGFVYFYDSPEDKNIEAIVLNGKRVLITITYKAEDGVLWGCCLDFVNQNEMIWICMDDCYADYTRFDFIKEHEMEFVHEPIQLKENQLVIIYQYPGSGIPMEEAAKQDIEESNLKQDYDYYYVDQEGQKWVNVQYKDTDGWVCVTDPSNRNLPAKEGIHPNKIYPPVKPNVWNQMTTTMKIMVVVVLLVVLLTAAAIRHIYRREKRKL